MEQSVRRITDGDKCAMGPRLADGTVEVWHAQSDDAVNESAQCPATSATAGLYMTSPH